MFPEELHAAVSVYNKMDIRSMRHPLAISASTHAIYTEMNARQPPSLITMTSYGSTEL
jgi:hypothetical protein